MIDETVLAKLEITQMIINGIKFDVECPNCHRKWGVYLDDKGKFPYKWDWCVRCADERRSNVLSKLRD
jgi:hypothetical protein